MKKLQNTIRKWEERCESENYHSRAGDAQYLADVLLKYVSPEIAAKIVEEGLSLECG
jgi:hypothetical protein